MKHSRWGWLCGLLLVPAVWAQDMTNPGYVPHPDWFKQSFLDLREDIEEAAAENRHLMVYFYQDGCPYCRMFIENDLGQYDIAQYAQQHFDVIAINIFGALEVTDVDGEMLSENKYAQKSQVMFTPTVLVYDSSENVVFRMNGYYPPPKLRAVMRFISEKQYANERFVQYYQRHDIQQGGGELHIETSTLEGPPFDLSDRKRPLLVLFEQKECLICDELHLDIFQRPETAALLQKFDIAVLDIRTKDAVVTPSGGETTHAPWAAELNVKTVPTQIFFDLEGQEVFRNEGYVKSFHVQSMLDYVASGEYKNKPDFQRYLQARADHLREQGVEIEIMQ